MTPDDLNRQVALRKGWQLVHAGDGYSEHWLSKSGVSWPHAWSTDYNRAHSLLDDLSDEEWEKFREALCDLLDACVADPDYERRILTATPAQICEAWLKATEGRK